MADGQDRPMSPRAAMLRAWMIWFVLVLASAATTGLAIMLSWQPAEAASDRVAISPGLVFNLVFFVVVTTAAFVLHWRLFRRYWDAGYVTPRGYLIAGAVFWFLMTLVIVVLDVSCMVQGVFMPDMLLVFGAFILMLLSWPSGWAMTHARPKDEEDDEEILHIEENPDAEPER